MESNPGPPKRKRKRMRSIYSNCYAMAPSLSGSDESGFFCYNEQLFTEIQHLARMNENFLLILNKITTDVYSIACILELMISVVKH